MKYINKFIAAGLGFALMFTGTNFIHGWFTYSATQENIVTIPKPNIQLDVSHAYFYGKDTGGKKYNALYIPVTISGIDINKLNLQTKVDKKSDSTIIIDDYISFGKGVHTASDGYTDDTANDCLIINLPDGLEFGVKEKYNITITATIGEDILIFKGKYWLEKQNQSNDCTGVGGVRIQHIPMNEGHTNLDSKESILIENQDSYKEEEKPTEPEVVEQPNQEAENIVESEVLELPKEESIEILSQPESIEPPKEDEGIQE